MNGMDGSYVGMHVCERHVCLRTRAYNEDRSIFGAVSGIMAYACLKQVELCLKPWGFVVSRALVYVEVPSWRVRTQSEGTIGRCQSGRERYWQIFLFSFSLDLLLWTFVHELFLLTLMCACVCM